LGYYGLTDYRPAMPFVNINNILGDLFSSVLSQLKKHHPSGNLIFNNLGIFQSLKFRILMGKFLQISFRQNFTPNTLGCYGFMLKVSLRKLLFFCGSSG